MSDAYPRLLVIDDQFGDNAFLRAQFCERCGVEEIVPRAVEGEPAAGKRGAIAGAVFCTSQTEVAGRVENTIEEAARIVASGWPSPEGWRWALILLDLRFDSSKRGASDDEQFGLRILEHLVACWPDAERPGNCEIPIVVLSSMERARYGADANRGGAAEYVEKSRLDRQLLQQLLHRHALLEDSSGRIIGRSLPLLKVLKRARAVASEARGNLLILGEQGTGKSALARYIHDASPRRASPFQNLTVSPGMEPHLLKVQLFGFWYGAYTPADKSEAGLAERSHEGTLFVDEIANLPKAAHQELLQYGRLDETGLRHLNRLGTFPTAPQKAIDQANKSRRGEWNAKTETLLVDVFFLTATNKPIDNKSYREASGFPEDLFVRLGQEYHAPIRFPTLRERADDVVPLFMHFLREETQRNGGMWPKALDHDVIDAIRSSPWPGNVAELAGAAREVEKATRLWEEVHVHHLPTLMLEDQSPERLRPVAHEELDAGQATSEADPLTQLARSLSSIRVRDSRKELQGALKDLGDGYGRLLERLLCASLEATRDNSEREKGNDLGDLSPTRAMSLLLGKRLTTYQAADEIKRLVGQFPAKPDPESDSGRVLAWALNLRKGGRRTPSTSER